MLRRFIYALSLLAVLGFAAAQITVAPTVGSGDDVIAKGANEAAVGQTVVLDLPQATALHLAASTIEFDLEYLDGDDWEARARGNLGLSDADYACVYVSGPDVVSGLGGVTDNFWGQTQVVPGGIAYAAPTWDNITLIYSGNNKSGNVPDTERVVTYPPIRIDADGLVANSKDYFVCYQTFVIQLFSNFNYYDLQVSRNDVGTQGIEHLYIQGNACYNFGTPTGLYDLPDESMRHLLPRTMTAGPTGTHSGDCNPNSSWMDVLGVLAVKVNADHWGPSTANLTYTLLSSNVVFD